MCCNICNRAALQRMVVCTTSCILTVVSEDWQLSMVFIDCLCDHSSNRAMGTSRPCVLLPVRICSGPASELG